MRFEIYSKIYWCVCNAASEERVWKLLTHMLKTFKVTCKTAFKIWDFICKGPQLIPSYQPNQAGFRTAAASHGTLKITQPLHPWQSSRFAPNMWCHRTVTDLLDGRTQWVHAVHGGREDTILSVKQRFYVTFYSRKIDCNNLADMSVISAFRSLESHLEFL